MGAKVKVYESGMRLIVEEMKGYDSIGFNMYVNTGSVNEDDSNRGISHFIEHMLSKGTTNRSGFDIVNQLDSVGVGRNALTSPEKTKYFIKTTAEGLEECFDVYSDVFFNSVFDEESITKEKEVVKEEIAKGEDNAISKALDLNGYALYNGTNYEYPIAGTVSDVDGLTRDKILKYMKEYYTPENLTISVAGDVKLEQAEKLVTKFFESQFTTKNVPYSNITPNAKLSVIPSYNPQFKDNQQSTIIISFPALNKHDDKRIALLLLDTALSTGMSSILMQEIRRKLGLVYAIQSASAMFNCGGHEIVYMATRTENVKKAVKAVSKLTKKIAENGITKEQLEKAKKQVMLSQKMYYEDTLNISNYNLAQEVERGKLVDKYEVFETIKNTTLEEVNKIAKQIFSNDKIAIACVGQDDKTNLLDVFVKARKTKETEETEEVAVTA